MRKLIILISLLASLSTSIETALPSVSIPMYKMRATAYILTGTTASGEETRHGICATGRREWLGKRAKVYKRLPDGSLGAFIGEYEILDTGCKKHVIDVWCDGMDEAQAFMDLVYENGCKGKIYVQIIDETETDK